MSLGATGYLVKPFQEEALLQYVDRLVRESRGRLEAAS
jgi:DNA-binding response OmpR family regulator